MIRAHYEFDDESLLRRRHRGHWPLLIALGVLLSPLIVEQSIYYAAQWAHLRRGQAQIRTPISDAVVNWCQELVRWGISQVNGHLDRLPWDPWIVIVCGLVLAGLMMIQFRRCN